MSLKILLLEDDPGLVEITRAVLEHERHTVTSTASGVEALMLASREQFDLAILDVEVDELSGLGVERVLGDLDGLPVVVVSGRRNGWRREALRAGAVACLQKPYPSEKLLALASSIEASRTRGEPFAGDVRVLPREDLDRIARMSSSALDTLPFGAIRLDAEGRVTTYNAFEANAAGLERSQVLGKRFVDVAPCTIVKEFVAAVERASRREDVDEVLRFVFPHHGAACVVSVRLYCAAGSDQLWLFVSKRATP